MDRRRVHEKRGRRGLCGRVNERKRNDEENIGNSKEKREGREEKKGEKNGS
jgi:hypothetical protein